MRFDLVILGLLAVLLIWFLAAFMAGVACCIMTGTWLIYKLLDFIYALKEWKNG